MKEGLLVSESSRAPLRLGLPSAVAGVVFPELFGGV